MLKTNTPKTTKQRATPIQNIKEMFYKARVTELLLQRNREDLVYSPKSFLVR